MGIGVVRSAGDVNGEGFDDLLIGHHTGTSGGRVFLVYGGHANLRALDTFDGANGEVSLSTALNASTGFVFQNSLAEGTARELRGVGDVNGDGYDDIVIGAPEATPNGPRTGRAYVVLGGSVSLAGLDIAEGGAADGRPISRPSRRAINPDS